MERRCILLIDDDEVNLRLFEARLLSADFDVYLAQSAAEAERFLASCKHDNLPNLIMLDVIMPDKDGFDYLVELKSSARYRLIPVVMVTALNQPEDRDRAFELGADDFISKPVNPNELIIRARNLTNLEYYQRQHGQTQQKRLGTILVAGKAEAFRTQLEALEEQYDVLYFDHGTALAQRLQQRVPDLVMIDHSLKEPSAYVLCQRIKSSPRAAHLPLVILDPKGNYKSAWEAEATALLTADMELPTWLMRIENLIRQKHRFDAMYETYDLLLHRSITDPLTGLYNRNYLDEIARREISLGQRNGRPFTFALLDIDLFKRVNDQHGHQTGDEVLREIAQLLKSHVRVSDVVARYGGEEFAIVLNNVEQRAALMVLERVRFALETKSWTHLGIDDAITISIGIASFPEASADIEGLMWKADNALYEAKGKGRNQIMMYKKNNSASELER